MPTLRIITRPQLPFLAPMGLREYYIRGDGNCLFSALSHQHFKSTFLAPTVRLAIVNHLRNNGNIYKQFVTADTTRRSSPQSPRLRDVWDDADCIPDPPETQERVWNRYLRRMAREGTYGSHLEIVAFCEIFRRPVHVLQRDGGFILVGEKFTKSKPLTLIYDRKNEHYSSVEVIPTRSPQSPETSRTTSSKVTHEDLQDNGAVEFACSSSPSSLPCVQYEHTQSPPSLQTKLQQKLPSIKIRLPIKSIQKLLLRQNNGSTAKTEGQHPAEGPGLKTKSESKVKTKAKTKPRKRQVKNTKSPSYRTSRVGNNTYSRRNVAPTASLCVNG